MRRSVLTAEAMAEAMPIQGLDRPATLGYKRALPPGERDMRPMIGLGILLTLSLILPDSVAIAAAEKAAPMRTLGASKKGPAVDAVREKCANEVASVRGTQRRMAKLRCIAEGKKKM
jgi:hypothetical protein